LRSAEKDLRREWREKLGLVSTKKVGGRLGKRVGLLKLSLDVLDARIEEAGGEEGLVFLICAQVASRVTLTEWCKHYDLERGLVWAFLTQKEEWVQQYYRALEGLADEYVGEVVGIADESTPEAIGVDKVRIDTRMKVASKYANGRFGDKPVGVAVQNNITIVHRSE
jgi:hypothetical protein